MIKTLRERKLKRALTDLYPRMQRFALRLCNDHHDAEDLVQQAYSRALERLEQFEEGTRLDSWMYRIVQNIYFNQRNAQAVVQRKRPYLVIENEQPDSSQQLESRKQLEQVLDLLAAMPEAYRLVLLMVSIEGLSYKEVAATLGIPIGTVTSRLARARKTISEQCNSPTVQPEKSAVGTRKERFQ
ncbi:RNA polymerase sigma factor [Aestuariirhabdus litorea]|uniref:RNA polymerase sigma factor n=1 Tax=Aestuariirhabdus litorea TaxID=2528527 RepID=A0A3P3VS25_9GAMM|nr:RNA polymerase sigma factor [Aestuariirhabdus litorea]RRJ84309.1 RNA polymerase sigma factor [Aestuariirhabdus litorea]RWW97532.1 sigma-70 family RNA polymerase sigma factor [Endozoicomonadaceae bacterium GTF-13]